MHSSTLSVPEHSHSKLAERMKLLSPIYWSGSNLFKFPLVSDLKAKPSFTFNKHFLTVYEMPRTILGPGITKICQVPSFEECMHCEKKRPMKKNKWQNVKDAARNICKTHIRETDISSQHSCSIGCNGKIGS